jgi:hypothetical protein
MQFVVVVVVASATVVISVVVAASATVCNRCNSCKCYNLQALQFAFAIIAVGAAISTHCSLHSL